jgi:hypothetical protein
MIPSDVPSQPAFLGLEFAPKKFEKQVADERGDNGDRKIAGCQNVDDCPKQAHFPSFSRALKFTHQKVGVEQKNNEARLGHSSPYCFLHHLNFRLFDLLSNQTPDEQETRMYPLAFGVGDELGMSFIDHSLGQRPCLHAPRSLGRIGKLIKAAGLINADEDACSNHPSPLYIKISVVDGIERSIGRVSP